MASAWLHAAVPDALQCVLTLACRGALRASCSGPGRMAVTASGWLDVAVPDALQCCWTHCSASLPWLFVGRCLLVVAVLDALQCVRTLACRGGRCLLDESVSAQLSYA